MLITQSNKSIIDKTISNKPPIKSFIYYAPNLEKTKQNTVEEKPAEKELITKATPDTIKDLKKVTVKKTSTSVSTKNVIEEPPLQSFKDEASKVIELPETLPKTSQPKPLPEPAQRKLDRFIQLQKLRSQLNKNSIPKTNNPYQSYQPPSVFNTNTKSVPHSVPLKDEEKEREKNTKNMGAGIEITKGDDGTCSITQDMSAYGLSEGSSTQYFSCGESKFDKSFREHMKKVKNKLGKD
ncbi:hypothetical protein H4J38_02590 [Colwellia sp. BRX10-3]|uniref:hypothetical protein n=1 Tax=Colwellia sp. BRX10-3 TaxID=2759844 RepID=UPI0015F5D96C|nr:hypothetical protein [Colwellia sp. BRX10-3]MBA6389660.1 hypothetical protein [Colwellia sp. BRX10-3]